MCADVSVFLFACNRTTILVFGFVLLLLLCLSLQVIGCVTRSFFFINFNSLLTFFCSFPSLVECPESCRLLVSLCFSFFLSSLEPFQVFPCFTVCIVSLLSMFFVLQSLTILYTFTILHSISLSLLFFLSHSFYLCLFLFYISLSHILGNMLSNLSTAKKYLLLKIL